MMIIQVLRKGWVFDYVRPHQLSRMIEDQEVVCFFRKEGMVIAGKDPMRAAENKPYAGEERRTA